jgi:chromosome segregation ATPase
MKGDGGVAATELQKKVRCVSDDAGEYAYACVQLDEAMTALTAKEEALAELESRLGQLQVDLDAALADAQTKGSAAEELRAAKEASEQEMQAIHEKVAQLQTTHDDSTARMEAISQEVRSRPLDAPAKVTDLCVA